MTNLSELEGIKRKIDLELPMTDNDYYLFIMFLSFVETDNHVTKNSDSKP